jgi:hypothetical protein
METVEIVPEGGSSNYDPIDQISSAAGPEYVECLLFPWTDECGELVQPN